MTLTSNADDSAILQRVAALNDHEDAKEGAWLGGVGASTLESIPAAVQLASDSFSGAAIADAIGRRFGVPSTGAADRSLALRYTIAHPVDTFRSGIDNPLQAASAAADRGDDVEQAYYEGKAAGAFVNAALGARGLVGAASGTISTVGRAATIVESANTAKVAAPLERRMEIKPDSEFGPLNQTTHEERVAGAGDRVVTFGGANLPKYADNPNATLGPKNGAVWVMPIDDAAQLKRCSNSNWSRTGGYGFFPSGRTNIRSLRSDARNRLAITKIGGCWCERSLP